MNTAVVGAARVVFGADSSEFDATAKGVEGVLGRLVERFHDVEARLKRVGTAATLGITLPFAAMVKTVDTSAGAFQSQMKKVEAALGNVSGEELQALSDQARTLGPSVGKGATEAAEAIEALGLAGVSTSDILGGALKAALDLSAAGMVDAGTASSLVTDVMSQFKVTAAELPGVVQNVVGALDSSKFGFDDFRLAVGQGGAIASSAGVGFLDFATAISATSTQFTSGADAGTSFKTYIQSLVPSSKDAERAMKKLGIEFFDAEGRMKPLAEQAQILRDRLGNLTDKSKTDALTTIFGSDASRTAIGLMEQGREGFEKLQATVAGGDVEAKIQKRLEGTEAAGKRIATAWESVRIAFALDTGLLDITAAIKNGFARMLEAVANAPQAVKQVGAAFATLGAIMGPLLMVLGHVGAMLLANFAAAKFGMIGRVLGLLISPVSTIIGLLGEMGLAQVLKMIGARLLGFMGPVGWAITAILLFKDSIVSALKVVWESMVNTLGPPIEALIAKVQGIFGKLSSGPIAGAVSGLIDMLMGLKDVVGTILVAAIELAGELIERALGVIVAAFSGLVDVVSGVVDLITALLTGDFAGAWQAITGIIEAVFGAIIDMAAALVPEVSIELRLVYEAAKAWLADGFNSVMGWLGDAVRSGVDYVAKAFPGVVDAARSVYQGVKAWLVDAFGGIMSYVGGAVKWIVDQYGKVKKYLGLGEATAAPAAPPQPKPADAPKPKPQPKRSVSFDDDDDTKKKKRPRKGRDTSHDAQNREQLAFQTEIEAARLRGDIEAEAALRRKMDLSKQIEAYQRTGLSLAAATAAAQRDMATLEEARREGQAKELARGDLAHSIDVARLAENRSLEEALDRQREFNERILGFQRDGLTLAEATVRATRQQAEIDEARAAIRARLIADDAQDRQLRLAQDRGDTEERIRQLQREVDIRERARQLERDLNLDPTTAREQAGREWDEGEKARQTGVFRDTFKDGVRAAMDGDLKGWVKNWWKDRVAKGMEEALNSLADLIASLFAKAGQGSGGSSGGIGGAIASVLGSVFGKSGPSLTGGVGMPAGTDGTPIPFDPSGLPGFKTGGSFKIAGRAGIDQNVVAFRATAGEMVDVRKPGNDNGPAGVTIHAPLYMEGAVDLASKEYAERIAHGHAERIRVAMVEAQKRRG